MSQSASVTTQSAQTDYYDSQAEDVEGELATQEPTQQSNEPARMQKLVRLTDEQEEAMADWLKDNTVLYNKGKKEYRDGHTLGLNVKTVLYFPTCYLLRSSTVYIQTLSSMLMYVITFSLQFFYLQLQTRLGDLI